MEINYDDRNDNESKCDTNRHSARIMKSEKMNGKNCFLITKINATSSTKIDEYYECKCNRSNLNDCEEFKFWSTKSLSNYDDFEEDFETDIEDSIAAEKNVSQANKLKKSCYTAGDYACFNNGTCLDDHLSGEGYSCKCLPFFTGKR